ncbi:DUF4097 family beta strand repeat protein [candidate division WOR-3 bacterium]|nr:DUF4097 family beta strand repeat protein [candidate division WOR-3 bacterium]
MNFSISDKNLTLDVNLRNSNLEMVFEEREDAEVLFEETRRNAAEERFKVKLEDGILTLRERKTKSWMKNFAHEPDDKEKITVKLPLDIQLKGSVISYGGDIETKDMNFSGKMLVYSGDAVLQGDTKGDSEFKIYSGDLTCGKFSGNFTAQIYSGDIEIKEAFLESIELKSYSGDIRITGSFNLCKNSEIKTLSGDTSLTVKDFTGDSELLVKSLSGEVTIDGEYPPEKIRVQKLSEKFADMNAFHLPRFRKIFSELDGIRAGKEKEIRIDEDSANIQKILDMVSQGKLDASSAEKLIIAIRKY